MNKTKPNIIYFVADQMRRDSLHHHGNQASVTPHLDALASEGVSFTNAYCQNPVCSPSRCSFLSGLYPHTTGHRTMHYLLQEEEPNILKTMKEQGYEVIWIGRNDLVPASRDKSAYCDAFYDGASLINQVNSTNLTLKKSVSNQHTSQDDPYFYAFYEGKKDEEHKNSFDWYCLNAAISYIKGKRASSNQKPFFLYCTLIFPHPPYACEEPWFSSINRSMLPKRRPSILHNEGKSSILREICRKQGLTTWSEEMFHDVRACYLAMVSRLDEQFGMLSDALKEEQLYDQTSIFVFSDHGDFTTDYAIAEKCQNSFEDCLSNVPLIIKPAAQFEVKPRITPALAELVDLTPTVAQMCGLSLDYVQFGKSLLPVLAGQDTHKDAVFCEGGRIHGEIQAMEPARGPESALWPRISTQQSEGPEHTKACMIRMNNLKYTMRLYEQDELYDLDQDPMELHNLIHEKAYEQQLIQLKGRMLQMYMETADYVPRKCDKR